MVKICETECLWNGRTKARIHTEGRTQHRNWNLKKRGGRVGLLGQPSDPNRAAMGLSVRQWALCAYGLAPLRFSLFFSVSARMFHKANPARLHSYQKVPQMVLLIILISWKEGKKPSFQLFTFQKPSISIWRIQCVFPSPSITTNQTIQTWKAASGRRKGTRQGMPTC